MREALVRMVTQLREYFGKMSRGNRIRLAILAAVVITLAIVAVSLLTRTNFAVLYTAQDNAEAGEVIAALRERNVPFEIEGTRILVPEKRVSELQAELATQGVIGASGADLSIMQNAAGFGVTESYAQKIFDAALGENIRTAILVSPKIYNAVVIVNSGETSPFRRASNTREATCAIMLTLSRGATLTNPEAQTIAEHVRASVPGISYENISIADNNLNYYKIGDDSIDLGTEMHLRLALENLLTEQTKIQVEQLVTPIYGMSNVKTLVTIRLNFDKMVTESVEFSPPVAGEIDGIVRSSSELWEAQRKSDAAEGVPGTDSNAMGTVEYPFGSLEDNESYRKALMEKTYDLNETRTRIERAQGKVEYLSIAVLINSDAVEEDYSAEIENLVSRGLGVATANLSVESVPFIKDTTLDDLMREQQAIDARERQRELIQTIIRWAVILLLGLAFITLIRTIVKTVKPPPEPVPVPVLADGGYGIDYIAADGDEDDVTDITEYESVELHTKSAGLEQIEKFIERDPAAVAQLLRNWLTDE